MTDEQEIKSQVCDWINRQSGSLVIVHNNARIRRRHKYFRKGITDITGIWNRRPMFVEIKVSDGKISIEQDAFIFEARSKGAVAFVASSLEDAIKKFQTFDALLK